MKFTLSWLKEHLDTDAAVSAVADKLTMIGLEVESLADKATLLAKRPHQARNLVWQPMAEYQISDSHAVPQS